MQKCNGHEQEHDAPLDRVTFPIQPPSPSDGEPLPPAPKSAPKGKHVQLFRMRCKVTGKKMQRRKTIRVFVDNNGKSARLLSFVLFDSLDSWERPVRCPVSVLARFFVWLNLRCSASIRRALATH